MQKLGEKMKKELKSFCYLFYLLAMVDGIEAIIFLYVCCTKKVLGLTALANVSTTRLKVTTILCAIFCIITCLLKTYLGNKGIEELKGNYKGTSHLKLASILGVISIVGSVISIVAAIQGDASWFECVGEAATVAVLFMYRSYCKTLLENKK